MIQRTALAAAGIAAALSLVACTSPDSDEPQNSQTAEPSAQESTGDSESDSGTQTAHGEIVEGFPEVLQPLPDSEVISSSMSPYAPGQEADDPAPADEEGAAAGEDEDAAADEGTADAADGDAAAPDAEEDAGEDAAAAQVVASLVMRTDMNPKDILRFYEESLEEHGFTPVSESSDDDDIAVQAFHAEDDNQTVSVSIGPDPADESLRIVTVGGVVTQ